MTRNDIIRMARETGFDQHNMYATFTCNLMDIERLVHAAYAAGAAAEREACARVCEDEICACCWDDDAQAAAEHLAAAIRARGQA